MISAPVNDQWFGDDVFHAEARVKRGERVLKNNLQVADLILKWIDEHVENKQKGANGHS